MYQQTLMSQTLETNRIYAQKLAKSTDVFLKSTLQTLETSAKELAPYMTDRNDSQLFNEAKQLKDQTDTFNAVLILDAKGNVLANAPQTLELIGKPLNSLGGKEALKTKKPLISKPYISLTNKLVIFISYPIFNEEGQYLGLVGGSLYLKEMNILYQFLGEHFYHDGSYVYVVDEDGRVIYHPKQERISDVVSKNPVVHQLMSGRGGSQRVVNTKGEDMLAGYAYIPIAKWGVVSQQSTSVALAPAKQMITEMLLTSLPLILISILLIWSLSKRISKPLQQLAYHAEHSSEQNQEDHIKNIHTWYYEAIQLKKALVFSLSALHDKVNDFMHQSTTDPLTKLYNRRMMNAYMNEWLEQKQLFSLILLDIDHFKQINDTYGHAVGDEVLLFLAEQLKKIARAEDISCRYGGEEFVLLLPETGEETAYQTAETLRSNIANTISPCGKPLTISIGISTFPNHAKGLDQLFNQADQCLYLAKKAGRNQTILYKKLSNL
ncbi:sensor domain-containing diguanylate cyclase [Bacillus sp. REN10]|uniref:sensor domain-containing diguanylate cyclase n=1 Tax=Bacillus sp. REN10 TaxID=2782541 RepID=UPI001EEDDA0C|nr:sensor domain-containing diguanylate cyclase [Bacillus sp. REN10]